MQSEDWIPPTYTDLRTANFEKHPFYCADCDKDVQFKNPQFEYQGKDKHKVIMHASMTTDALCGHCLANRIRKWFKTPAKELKSYGDKRRRAVCEICSHKKIVATVMWEDQCNVRFGSSHWNGHWICKDCLCETAENGIPHSNYTVHINNDRYYMNEVGARILYPGKSK